jgi:glutamyl-tRNA synthetase
MALLSLMARLGSSDPVELRTNHQDLIDGFDLGHFGAAPTKFDVEDLRPLTARYLHSLPLEAVADRIAEIGVPDDMAARFWNVVRENIGTRAEIDDWWTVLSQGARSDVDPEDADFVQTAMGLLPDLPFDESTWSTWTAAVKAETGRKGKGLFLPLRKALTGRRHGPEMADFMPLMQALPKV